LLHSNELKMSSSSRLAPPPALSNLKLVSECVLQRSSQAEERMNQYGRSGQSNVSRKPATRSQTHAMIT
jgi:hypothetical protein